HKSFYFFILFEYKNKIKKSSDKNEAFSSSLYFYKNSGIIKKILTNNKATTFRRNVLSTV
ncbi:hypothetical protein, partial [Salmonella sp. s55004]